MPIKARQQISGGGGLGPFSGWTPSEVADFTNANIAAATTEDICVYFIPPTMQQPALGSDSYPPGGTLAAASASRQIGTGAQQVATLGGAWILHRTSAGAIYSPASGSTIDIQVISLAAGQAEIRTSLTAGAVTLAGLTVNRIDPVTLVPPADRGINFGGSSLAGAVALFPGDLVVVRLVVTAALNVQGNTLAVGVDVF